MKRGWSYLFVYTGPLAGWISLYGHGMLSYTLLLYAFAFIPLMEGFIPPQTANLSREEEEKRRKSPVYDWIIWMIVPVHYGLLFFFFLQMKNGDWNTMEVVGKTITMGILCGAIGINAAHELGHRHRKMEQGMAKALLLTSLYMHFFIEHNRGHHKDVSTWEDPGTARRGESLFAFWLRAVKNVYIHAWELENTRLRRAGKPIFSIRNEMLGMQLLQTGFVAATGLVFGMKVMLPFLAAATFGFLLLETVNYIEHYGLQRRKDDHGMTERVMPWHSWNSDHVLGRLMLFELSRHSDHHYHAGRKYQVLRHFDNSPQMPTGYPGMMLMALVPPLWFHVMDPRADAAHRLSQLPTPTEKS